MGKLPTQQIKDWLDAKPEHREIIIHMNTEGIYVQLRQLSQTLDKLVYTLSWEEILYCNLDMLDMKLQNAMSKMKE